MLEGKCIAEQIFDVHLYVGATPINFIQRQVEYVCKEVRKTFNINKYKLIKVKETDLEKETEPFTRVTVKIGCLIEGTYISDEVAGKALVDIFGDFDWNYNFKLNIPKTTNIEEALEELLKTDKLFRDYFSDYDLFVYDIKYDDIIPLTDDEERIGTSEYLDSKDTFYKLR